MIEMLWMMSIQSCILILIVLLMRFLLRKYPKIYSYSLWALVLIRLLCPVFIESAHSLQPELDSSRIDRDYGSSGRFEENMEDLRLSGKFEKDEYDRLGMKEAGGIMQKENVLLMLKLVYVAGAVLMAGRYVLQYMMLKRRIMTAVQESRNVWLCEGISSPFVMGIFCPGIYLPYGIPPEEKQYILKHEMTHIRHKDPIIRYLGIAASCLHWWNPLVWYAVYKMNQDMEMFCDESVLAKAALNEKKLYANTLLQFAIRQSRVSAALPFGASNTEKRICNVLQKKKRSFVVIGVVTLTGAFCMGAFMTVPLKYKNNVVQENSLGQLTESTFLSQLPGEAFQEQLSKEVYPMGDWQVTSLAGTARVYGADRSEIEKMIGARLKYGKDFYKNETSDITHDKIFYSREEQTKEEFEELWGIPLTELGVTADKVYYFEAEGTKESSLKDFFYMTDAETMLIVYNGVFFKAERVV